MRVLREILNTMSPGERSRLNAPIAARQRIMAELARRAGGTEEKSRTSPVSILKRQRVELEREVAHLEERLAAAEKDTSLFDLRRDSAAAIVKVITDPTVISESRAKAIAKGITDTFKARTKPAG